MARGDLLPAKPKDVNYEYLRSTRSLSTSPPDKADFDKERTAGARYKKQEASARGILGPNTFRRRGNYADVIGGSSEGAGATQMLDRGATPSDLVRHYRGSLDRDIELPKETKRKAISAPRSMSGGKR